MVVGLLAVLSASAAGGMRIALPLLVIGLLQKEELWSNVPVLSKIDPRVLVVILIIFSLIELLGSKQLLGQRILQIIQLIFSPIVGAVMGITVARSIELEFLPIWLIGVVGGILALILKLVEIGWFSLAGHSSVAGFERRCFVRFFGHVCHKSTRRGRLDCFNAILVGNSQCSRMAQ